MIVHPEEASHQLRPVSPRRFVVTLAAVVLAALSACASTPPQNNGVNDVRKACELRAGWTNTSADKCGTCQAAAQRPACGCEGFKGFDGVCADQGAAFRAEPSCTDDVINCVARCVQTDCACVEGCYANAPACKRVAAARDGCVTDLCAKYCN
jgi:hypothetical protein